MELDSPQHNAARSQNFECLRTASSRHCAVADNYLVFRAADFHHAACNASEAELRSLVSSFWSMKQLDFLTWQLRLFYLHVCFTAVSIIAINDCQKYGEWS